MPAYPAGYLRNGNGWVYPFKQDDTKQLEDEKPEENLFAPFPDFLQNPFCFTIFRCDGHKIIIPKLMRYQK